MKSKFRVQLFIDGKEESIEDVEFMYQENPWPGDHRYRLVLTGENIKKHFYTLKEHDISKNLDRHVTEGLFVDCGHIKYEIDEPYHGLSYFINNIEKIEVMHNQVILEGICSTISSPEDGNRRYYEAYPIAYDIDNILRKVDPLNFIKNSLPHHVHTDEERNKLVVKLNQTKTEEQRFAVLEMLKTGLPAGHEYNSVREFLVSKIDKIKTKEELRKLLNGILEKLFIQLKIEPEKMEILVNSLYSSLQKFKV